MLKVHMEMLHLKNFLRESSLSIIIFLFLLSSSFFYFNFQMQNNINNFLTNLNQLYETQYNAVYDNFNKLSQNSFYGIINKPDVYNLVKSAYKKDEKLQDFYRQMLYKRLISDYSRLKDFNFYQLHFYFPDNKSFLRMHKPEKFGDDLSNYRLSVGEVNKNLKPLHGYEIGKVMDGFRFVYPLFDEKLFHIGSVELSVGSDFFEGNFERNFDVDTHFLINKSIAEKNISPEQLSEFEISNENDEYLYKEDRNNELNHYTNDHFYTQKEKAFISEKMKNSESFSFYKKDNNKYIAISFLAIKNIAGEKNTAYLALYKNSDFIEQVVHNYYKIILILFLILLLFIFFINYRYRKVKEERNKEYILSQQTKMAAVGEMIQNISHQWRQPLSVISVLASGLKLKKECNILDDKEFFENLEAIVNNTNNLSCTIEDFRNYFDESQEKKIFNLKILVEQISSIFKEELNAKNITLIENIDDIEICTYESELKRAIINLLKNAKDFTDFGVVMINVHEKKEQIIIEIQDSAGGIPNNMIKKIFEPYFTTKYNSSGIGLGLYSSYEIITKKLKGKIIVENREFNYNFQIYKGACFSIILDRGKL